VSFLVDVGFKARILDRSSSTMRKCFGLSSYDLNTIIYFCICMSLLAVIECIVYFVGDEMRSDFHVRRMVFVLVLILIYLIGFTAGIVTARASKDEYEYYVIKRYLEENSSSQSNRSVYGTFPLAMASSKDNARDVAC